MKKCLKHSFSLVELVIVIAVIAILISLLTPSLQKAMGAARMVSCMDKLKNIGTAYSNALDDRNEVFYRPRGAEQNLLGSGGHVSTVNKNYLKATAKPLNKYIQPDIKNTDLADFALCPTDNGKVQYDLIGTSYGHGANNVTNRPGKGNCLRRVDVISPAKMILIEEWSAHHVFYKAGGYENIWSLPLHGEVGEYNTLFVDNHVSYIFYIPGKKFGSDWSWVNF